MAANSSSKLTIEAYIKAGKKDISQKVDTMSVQVNPNSISRKFEVEFEKTEAIGDTSGGSKFKRIKDETVDFTLQFDGTGIVDSKNIDIAKQIQKLRNLIGYFGNAHETSYLKLTWGETLKNFTCRASGMTVNYKMFKPNGDPLRAEVTLSFKHYSSPAKRQQDQDKQSPDLTHVKEVRVGDSLPVMCREIYDSTSYYLQIAKINNLVNPRYLKPGQKLIFPPLKK